MKIIVLGALASLSLATPAAAATVFVDFDTVGDFTFVEDFYASQGLSFSADALAVTNLDGGGLSDFDNPPSPFSIVTFVGDFFNVEKSFINVAAGFDTGFAFFYSADKVQTVTIYDGLNGSGNVLGSIDLAIQYDQGCTPGRFCNWTAAGTSFAGTARSVDFTLFNGATGAAAFDNITFGQITPVIPEPASWAMLVAGFGIAGVALRRRKPAVARA